MKYCDMKQAFICQCTTTSKVQPELLERFGKLYTLQTCKWPRFCFKFFDTTDMQLSSWKISLAAVLKYTFLSQWENKTKVAEQRTSSFHTIPPVLSLSHSLLRTSPLIPNLCSTCSRAPQLFAFFTQKSRSVILTHIWWIGVSPFKS